MKTTSSFSNRGEDAAETFEPPEQAFDFAALFIKSAVVLPGMDSVRLGRNHRNHAQVQDQLPCLIAS